jgi:hypothetical protein
MKTKKCLKLSALVLSAIVITNTAMGIERQFVINGDYSVLTQDKWFGDYYVRNGQVDTMLKVGGWGDSYLSMIKMPINLPVPGRVVLMSVNLNLYSFGSTRPTTMGKVYWTAPWSENSTSDHWSLIQNNQFQYPPVNSLPAPPVNGWYSIDIGAEYYNWLTGGYQNYGIGLFPLNNDNRFNYFYSSRGYDSSLRPRIVVNYEMMPYFKVPLPGGKYWKCNTVPGGSSTHQGANFYAIDFSYRHYDEQGNLIENKTDIPILAAADGTVIETGNDPVYNGNYVKLDHDLDNLWGTGIQTVYLHMKNGTVAVHQGQFVHQGDLLGIMGTTGESTGVHLHFQFYFKHQGSSQATVGDNSMLNLISVEDSYPINSFLEGYFYQSSNSHWSF